MAKPATACFIAWNEPIGRPNATRCLADVYGDNDTIIIVNQPNVACGGSGSQTNVVNSGRGAGGPGAAGGLICPPPLVPTFSLFETALYR